MARKAIFNPRRHRLLRTRIGPGENLATMTLGVVLIGVVAWIYSTRNDFDPAKRDLPVELLNAERPKIEIYTPPLKPWVEPGSASAVTGASIDPGLFPPAVATGDWKFAGRVRKFDATNLYEKINGEAEKFLGLGFVAMHYAVLRHRTADFELAVELFDQGSVGGSTGAFSAHGAAAREVDSRAGVTFFMTSIGVIGRVGRYFFRAAGSAASEAVQRKAAGLVDALAVLAGGGSTPAEATSSSRQEQARAPAVDREAEVAPQEMQRLMHALGAGESQIRFKAKNAFQLDFAKAFWFASLNDEGQGAEAFVHQAPTARAAEALLEQLLEEQAHEYRPVRTLKLSGEVQATVLQHEFLGTYFAIAHAETHIFGVHRLNDSVRLESILSKLSVATAPGDDRASSLPRESR